MPITDRIPNFVRQVHPAPGDLIRVAARQAVDSATLLDLAKRSDTPQDVLSGFLERNDPSITAAVYARHAIDPATLPNSALIAVLKSGSNPEALNIAIARFRDKPTKALAGALAVNPIADAALATRVLEVLNTVSPNAPVSVWPELINAIGRDKANEQLATVQHPSLMLAYAAYDVDTDLLLAAARRTLTHAGLAWKYYQVSDAVTHLLSFRAKDDRSQFGTSLAAALLPRWAGASRWVATAKSSPRVVRAPGPLPWADVSIADAAQRRGKSANDDDPMELAMSSDPAVLEQLIENVEREHLREYWLRALLANPALPVHVARKFLRDEANRTPDERILYQYLDLPALFPDDADIEEAWLEMFSETIVARFGWAPFGGRCAAPRWLAKWLDDYNTTAVIAGLSASLGHDLDDLPAGCLKHLLNTDTDAVFATRALLARRLDRSLGSDPARWAMLDALADGFTGTLGELLSTCEDANA